MRDFGLVFWIRRSVGAVLWWLMSYDNAIVITTGRVVVAAQKHNVRNIIIDEVGVGAGVLDTLKEDRRFNAKGLSGSNRADNSEKYLNTRAQIFDGLRQRFADGDVSIPNDPELISQLASLTYKYTSRGQLQVESKDQIQNSGRQSPDKVDALALAFTAPTKKPQRKFKMWILSAEGKKTPPTRRRRYTQY